MTGEKMKPTLGEFPCNNCIIKAICNNFDCSIVEEYLTCYHNNLSLFTANEIKTYRISTDQRIKKIMNFFISKKYDEYCYESSICIKEKYYLIGLIKECDNRLVQKIRIRGR